MNKSCIKQIMKEHISAMQNKESGYKLATLSPVTRDEGRGRFAPKSKSSSMYWMADGRLFKFARGKKTQDSSVKQDADYSCRIAFSGRREQFQLHTANKAEAAAKAAAIYREIAGKGWELALQIHKPRAAAKEDTLSDATVGSLIEANLRLSSARPESLDAYSKALRRIASGVFEIQKGNKFDSFRGGRAAWLEKIDRIPLAELTPTSVLAWRNRVMKGSRTPEERGRAAVTVNSLIRNAKSLLSKKVRPFIESEMKLPSPLFFEGVSAEQEPSLRYRSKIDAEAILKAAQRDLAIHDSEAFKLLLLVFVFGLRRSEADTLTWQQFDFNRRILVIEDTEHKRLKSKDSAGEIDLEPEFCNLFRGFKEKTQGLFVLESPQRIRKDTISERKSRGYRCEATHVRLLVWLRAQGVGGLRPIHTLRKEIGAVIASRDGIWKASRYLRHSDIRITSRLYSDKKVPVTSGLAGFLAPN